MRTIIAGSRDIVDYDLVKKAVEASGMAPRITTVVSGTARGVDRLGERWAIDNEKFIVRYPAEWHRHGKSAGAMRNAVMADNAKALIALWDGKSPGTRNMIELASRKGLEVFVYRTDQQEETSKEDPLRPA